MNLTHPARPNPVQSPTPAVEPSTRRRPWKTNEVMLLRELYPATSNHVLARLFKRTSRAVFSKAHELGLHKNAAFFRRAESGRLNGSSGQATRFQKCDGDGPASCPAEF